MVPIVRVINVSKLLWTRKLVKKGTAVTQFQNSASKKQRDALSSTLGP